MSDLLGRGRRARRRDPRRQRPAAAPAERRPTVAPEAPYELVERIRASIVVLGPLLARCGRRRVSMPGRRRLRGPPHRHAPEGPGGAGRAFELRHGYLEGRRDGLRGASITLEFPSVGATENIVMAAVHAKGTTVLDNAAREPEIADLCHFLNAMGAQIDGVGSSTVMVHGVSPGACRPTPPRRARPGRGRHVPRRASAWPAASSPSTTPTPTTWRSCSRKLGEMGMTVTDTGSGLWATAPDRLRSVDVATLPYPGVATDYKPLVTAMLAVADGVGIVTENLFAGRFRYVEELVRMGADIRTDSHHAVVRGVPRLSAPRCGPTTSAPAPRWWWPAWPPTARPVISGAHHIDRGYENIVGKLRRSAPTSTASTMMRRHPPRASARSLGSLGTPPSAVGGRRFRRGVGVDVVALGALGRGAARLRRPAAAAARSTRIDGPEHHRASRPSRPGGRRSTSPAAWTPRTPCRCCGSRPRSRRPCRR